MALLYDAVSLTPSVSCSPSYYIVHVSAPTIHTNDLQSFAKASPLCYYADVLNEYSYRSLVYHFNLHQISCIAPLYTHVI